METIRWEKMKIAGLKIRTSNKNAMENQTIAAAWNDFFEQEIFLQIEQRLDQNIYWVYANFDEWFSSDSLNKEYDLFIGCKVPDDFEAFDNIEILEIPEQNYQVFTAKWKLPDAVIQQWEKIWKSGVSKNFSYDIEVYGDKSQLWDQSEVDILIGVN